MYGAFYDTPAKKAAHKDACNLIEFWIDHPEKFDSLGKDKIVVSVKFVADNAQILGDYAGDAREVDHVDNTSMAGLTVEESD